MGAGTTSPFGPAFFRCSSCNTLYDGYLNACPQCGGRLTQDPRGPAPGDAAIPIQASQGPTYGTTPGVDRYVLIVTTNDIPGHKIVRVHGDVFGMIVRARGFLSNKTAQFMTVIGGEVKGYTKLLADSRNEARTRLMEAAWALGANAVVAMRFDCNEIADVMDEITCYGTAVTIEPMSDEHGGATR
jgi:uncharacterized protein YbjQ (UPF0145 family)